MGDFDSYFSVEREDAPSIRSHCRGEIEENEIERPWVGCVVAPLTRQEQMARLEIKNVTKSQGIDL